MKNEMAICQRCKYDDKIIPLISTMVFPGAEFWCPYCGNSTGMRGRVASTKVTKSLQCVHDIYRAHANRYLGAKGDLSCSAKEIDNKRVNREDFPAEMIKGAKAIVAEGWVTGRLSKDLKDVGAMKDYLKLTVSNLSREMSERVDLIGCDLEEFDRSGIIDIISLKHGIDEFLDYLKNISRIDGIISKMT